MNFSEKLNWILDKKGNTIDENYQENIDFVHSLGKKCDCVGWSELDMDESDADEVLDKIHAFCKENGWHARGWYERTFIDVNSDWYELKTEAFKDNTVLDFYLIESQTGNELYLETINAFREINVAPKEGSSICVPDCFRKACLNNGITDVDFCWVQDKGKYEAEQYFYIFPKKHIARIIYDRTISKKQMGRLQALGGYLAKIASVFYTLDQIHLQDCYLKEDMPSGGIACVYCSSTDDFCGRYKILIHKDTAEKLVNEKALSRENLNPACIVDKCPDGYELDKTEVAPIPSKEYIENCFRAYENLKAKARPEYIIKENEALKLFRKAKSERKYDFNKRISKKYIEEISYSIYNSILPYYQVSNGALLSDEYTFLSYSESLKITEEFFANLEKEELLARKPVGIVLAICANGDAVLLTEKMKVIRFSHETSDEVSEWHSIAKFFVESINDTQ